MKIEERPPRATLDRYLVIQPMLGAAHREIGELSKKKPDGILNAFKVKQLNRLLNDLRALLASDPSLGYLEVLDEESLPSNSDAAFVLSQYLGALEQFKEKHYGYDTDSRDHRWFTREEPHPQDEGVPRLRRRT
jgi:hypothetical protein